MGVWGYIWLEEGVSVRFDTIVQVSNVAHWPFKFVCYVKSTSFKFIVTDLVLFASVASIPEYKSRDKTWTLQIRLQIK